MEKLTDTKKTILDSALKMARSIGFESISIGELAKNVGMSKSGLFAHFKSKETLQVMVIEHAAYYFSTQVIRPALTKPRGLTRLKSLIDNWVTWSLQNAEGSCPLITAAVEFDDRPGIVKEVVKKHLTDLHLTLTRAVIISQETGEIKKDTDPEQMAQEIFSFIMAYHLYKKTMDDIKSKKRFHKSIDELIQRNLETI